MIGVKTLLGKFAQWLDKNVQGGTQPQAAGSDYWQKSRGLSIVDNVSSALTPMVIWDFKWSVRGETDRAYSLNDLAGHFADTQLSKAVQTALNTGDVLAVPIYTHGRIITQLVDNDGYNIIDAAGDELYEVQFVLDAYETRTDKYALLEDIRYDYNAKACIYSLYVAKNGNISSDLSQVKKWAGYEQQWIIPNVDRMLVGRLKCPTVDPARLNNVKGVPLCLGAGDAIEELKKLYAQASFEYEASEKMVFADKTLFKKDRGSDGQPTERLPRGKERVIQPVGGNGSTAGMNGIQEYSPTIRAAEYEAGIQMRARQLEQSIGVNHGILSMSTASYENVDNVRKSQQKTNSLIASIRRATDAMLSDLLYAWNAISNYYGITPLGDYDDIHDWSDEYITTFDSKLNQLRTGLDYKAITRAELRAWITGDDVEDAQLVIDEIDADSVDAGQEVPIG